MQCTASYCSALDDCFLRYARNIAMEKKINAIAHYQIFCLREITSAASPHPSPHAALCETKHDDDENKRQRLHYFTIIII